MSLQTKSFTLHAGQTLSDPVDCSGSDRVLRLIMPDGWTGAAPITFQMSLDGTNFYDLHHVIPNDFWGFEVTLPHPPSGAVLTFPPDMGTLVQWVKIRSGTAGAPVPQAADRTFQFVLDCADTTATGTQGSQQRASAARP
jgi:hypothetical protein